MLQYLIATPHILPANLMKLNPKSTEELVKLLKMSQKPLNQEMLLWLEWFHKNQCVLRHSINTHHSADSPLET